MAGFQLSERTSEAGSVAATSFASLARDEDTGLTDEEERTAEDVGATATETGTVAEDNGVTADETGTTAEDKTLLELEGSVSGFAAEDTSEVEDED